MSYTKNNPQINGRRGTKTTKHIKRTSILRPEQIISFSIYTNHNSQYEIPLINLQIKRQLMKNFSSNIHTQLKLEINRLSNFKQFMILSVCMCPVRKMQMSKTNENIAANLAKIFF